MFLTFLLVDAAYLYSIHVVFLTLNTCYLHTETIEFIPTAGSRLYIDPGEYGDLFVALRTFAREIERELLTLEKVIGGGRILTKTLCCIYFSFFGLRR